MRRTTRILLMIAIGSVRTLSAQSNSLDFKKMKSFEHQLDDVMEIIDTSQLKVKLKEVEQNYSLNPNEISKVRLGIIYHETALNLSFFSASKYKGYAKKSFVILSELLNSDSLTKELLPFIESYRASALSLVGAETKKLKYLGEAFDLFSAAIEDYSSVSYLPEFLRGSVAENLPWIFYSKRKIAKFDFESIIAKQRENQEYANSKIMSFTYWAWANQHQGRKDREKSLIYLEKAIELDPQYEAGRQKAEELKASFKK